MTSKSEFDAALEEVSTVSATAKKGGRPCLTCESAYREDIERAYAEGRSVKDIARAVVKLEKFDFYGDPLKETAAVQRIRRHFKEGHAK
jgi:hypothetical protein